MAKATAKRARGPQAPIKELISHRVITLANLLRRSASLRYRLMFGLALIEWRIIGALGPGRRASLNELARGMGLSKSQMSRGVAGLVERRLIARATNAEDNREIALTLSAEGRAIYAAMNKAAVERNTTLVAGMTETDLARLGALLDALTERAQALLRAEARAARDKR
jgi:DNA-binding MarR family transcriptional regulator